MRPWVAPRLVGKTDLGPDSYDAHGECSLRVRTPAVQDTYSPCAGVTVWGCRREPVSLMEICRPTAETRGR